MFATPESSGTSRRRFLALSAMLGAGALAAACGGAPASPTAAPKAAEPTKPAAPAATTAPAGATPTTAPAAKPAEPTKPAAPAATTAPAAAPAGQLTQKPRNRTLFLMWSGREGKYVDHELWNGYAVGANHQNGLGILHEPLAFFSAFAGKEILWLAESYKYSPDFKELTIKTRSGITWSDGTPFSANDVAFTIEGLKRQGAKVRWGIDVQQFVDSATATDANTVLVKFKVPAPRFFDLLTYKFDIGVYIVPKHIFEKQDDWSSFTNFDLAKGLPLTTGPWKVVFAAPDQKVIDRRDDWWAVKAGLAQLPKVERIVYLPNTGETQMAQAYITNQIDCSLDLRPNTIKTVLAQNPKIITHSGRELPYGYVDWWPTSLYLNNEKEPWNDKDVRWAISYFIDRKQVVEVGYGGAGTISKLPMPTYKPLLPYFDVVKDLLEKYDTTKFDPAAGHELLVKKGWKRGGDGFYNDDKGNRVKLEIGGSQIFADIGPVITEQLKRQGIDANYIMPPDMGQRFQRGDYTGNLSGHGGSVNDPYRTLRLYQSASLAVPGSHQSNFSRWKNADYDKIVDQVYSTPMDDQKKLLDLFRQAMQIWLPELPDIQITEWYHRIPMNTTYWTGWPTKDDPYVNGAFWHLTFQLILNRLTPTQ
jgi:peptide/nickel transport system substrate-binding protein